MKKYKLNKDKRDLTNQEIEQFKDFKKFKANYENVVRELHDVPLYKNKKMLFALFIILMITWLLMRSNKDEFINIPASNIEQID
tara:strand:- start:306 stop:557 length:252 start_codon:yes stop_codon:yes gene_type:complete